MLARTIEIEGIKVKEDSIFYLWMLGLKMRDVLHFLGILEKNRYVHRCYSVIQRHPMNRDIRERIKKYTSQEYHEAYIRRHAFIDIVVVKNLKKGKTLEDISNEIHVPYDVLLQEIDKEPLVREYPKS